MKWAIRDPKVSIIPDRDDPLDLIHPKCGGVFLVVIGIIPATWTWENPKWYRHKDGRPCLAGEPFVCDTCGERITYGELEDMQRAAGLPN